MLELSDYVNEIKNQITGYGILQSELPDESYEDIINSSLLEMNRYYNVTELKQVKAEKCIDLLKYPEIGSVVSVYRIQGVGSSSNNLTDPTYVSQLQLYNMNNAYQNNLLYRYGTYSLLQQIANTISTDLEYKEDKKGKKLYINFSQGMPTEVTIEYVPKLKDVSDVVSEFWQDILMRLSLARAKIAIGRIRTRYTQANALWSGDGDTILNEGTQELADIREKLRVSSDLILPLD